MLVEVQGAKGICHRSCLEGGKDQAVEVDVDRGVAADGGHGAADAGVFCVLAQVLAHLALDVGGVFEHGLERAVLGDEVRSLLGADAGYAGYVVAGVSLEAQEVRHLVWAHAVALLDVCRRHDGHICHALAVGDDARELG